MTRTSHFPSSMAVQHYTPQHSGKSDYMGFLGKKSLKGACALSSCADFILGFQ